ncbi:MAG TPA: metalloregulator ArsR/SmtB family transcription factor [Bacteroidota bacterium]|nr:metalloregulator ArsR/SmtB family transcription factor [Bacteroidota bacterium]
MKRKHTLTVLKALADETRLELLNLLHERPCYGEELAVQLKITPSTVSFHLNKLEHAGIVHRRKEQYYMLYALNDSLLGLRLRDLVSFSDELALVHDSRLEAYRRKVLSSFMRGGRLKQLPTQKKKRLIVLDHFAQRFTPGRTYAEAEVDAEIAQGYDDYCTIRRELVDEGYFTREHQRYIRTQPEGTLAHAASWHRSTPAQSDPGNSNMESYKDIKTRYKQTPPTSGVYQIRNTQTGRILLGSSLNLHGPWNKHRFALSTGVHSNKELQKDWNELGPDAFVFEVLETVKVDPDVNMSVALETLEKSWTAKLDPYGANGYNRFNVVKRIREA